MARQTLRTYREILGLKNFLILLGIPVFLFVSGFTSAGPTLSSKLIAGAIAVLPFPLIVVGVRYFVKLRYGRLFDQQEKVLLQFNAMSPDEIRKTALAAINSMDCFRAYPATSAVSLPHSAGEFFNDFDRLDFMLPGNPSPYFSICRTLVGDVPLNPEGVKVGELYIEGSCIVVHRETGRVTGHQPPIGKGEVTRCGELTSVYYLSLWHFVALTVARHRIEEELGQRLIVRTPLFDTRPRWRVDGAYQ